MAKDAEQFSKEETQKRMEAALRGARISGHKPMSEIQKAAGKKKVSATRKK